MLIGKLKKVLVDQSRHGNIINNSVPMPLGIYLSGSEISGSVTIEEGCKIYRSNLHGVVSIGRFSTLWGPNVYVGSHINPVIIGSFCSIARNVSIQESNHKTDCLSTYHMHRNIFNQELTEDLVSKGPIVVGSDVWIGANAVILSGVKIGHGSVIAAGAIVTKDVPPFAIVGGNPAKVIGYRFSEDVIADLIALRWWNWPLDRIKRNKNVFQGELTTERLKHII